MHWGKRGGDRRRTGRRRRRSPLLAFVGTVVAMGLLSGCGLQLPSDPDGTLARISGGELRVGASPSGELVTVDDGEVSGPLAELIEGFAEERDATVTWTVDSEEDLVHDLEAGRLDLAIGGMTASTPWSTLVSVTRGYPGIDGSGGAEVAVLLPLGENAFQLALETYLDGEVGR